MGSSQATPSIRLHFFNDHASVKCWGCAYTALALLTGEDPCVLSRDYKNKMGMTPEVMSKHLRQCGFIVTKLTHEFIADMQRDGKTLHNSHCILVSIRLMPKESSWAVVYGGVMWHNFEMLNTSYTTALAWPVLNSFLVSHPDWGTCVERKRSKKTITLTPTYFDQLVNETKQLDDDWKVRVLESMVPVRK